MRLYLFIFAFFAFSGCALSQPYTYDLQVDAVRQTGDTLSVDALLRIGGEPHTKIRLFVTSESAIRKMFDRKRSAGELEYSYFRIQTKAKIPEARPMRLMPRLDIVTKDVMQDIFLNEEYRRNSRDEPAWDGHLNPFPLKDESITAVSEITQNDFLGVAPKIVKP